MSAQLSWPAGYSGRPAGPDDVPAIHRLVAAAEIDRYGRVETDPDAIAADLRRPGLDPTVDTLLCFDAAAELAGWAWANRRSEVDVHPAHRGRGLGAALLDWTVWRARASGTARLVQIVPDGDAAATALVRSRGFEPKATQWLLGIDLTAEPELPEPPAGIAVRPFRAGDERAVHRLVEDAFDEWQQRRRSYEEWALLTVQRDAFAPRLSPLAFHGDELVGAVLSLDDPALGEGYVERVAVRRDHRNLGIARLLLRHAFAAFHRRGQRSCALWTHSETGALSLYERVGMSVRRSSTIYQKHLAAGR
ncbi:GNAT family N-acetyltransferase [Plantactinospora siamensis]|uniref:GNAT family N-acetyltransferase n=1 Tax=Plantactinospora siamensis TaxID=555372 RepID=A0ABV6P5Y9_9ACTN